ncbi:hypothetical protein PRUPE_8G103600 [Prunus persica]|uniref:Uncharacterized protein n=1 Tax=Prunus persica TaxID=3760 RepID=A0A251MW33_PRUPE|nr:hypothetical protein PRUPE_8G103600 [Prunus persica]
MDALSLSNLSAGDFAMDTGHEEAYEIPLNTGIQAELVLERLRGKRIRIGKDFFAKVRIFFATFFWVPVDCYKDFSIHAILHRN